MSMYDIIRQCILLLPLSFQPFGPLQSVPISYTTKVNECRPRHSRYNGELTCCKDLSCWNCFMRPAIGLTGPQSAPEPPAIGKDMLQ